MAGPSRTFADEAPKRYPVTPCAQCPLVLLCTTDRDPSLSLQGVRGWPSVTKCLGKLAVEIFAVAPGLRSSTRWQHPCVAALGSEVLFVPCYHPLQAFPGGPGQPRVVFDPRNSYKGSRPFDVPCGRCIGCRIAKARDWQTRMIHEAKLHEVNSFLTLTYSDEHLPSDGSLSPDDAQKFLKRLRSRLAPLGIRYFLTGEYGEKTHRPHYHLICFGWFPSDRKLHGTSVRGDKRYTSGFLDEVWGNGFTEASLVSAKAIGYVSRYALKKVTGERQAAAYLKPHPLTGELHQVLPEFARMSRRPGIGSGWFDRYHVDAFPSDFLIVDGKKRNVPVYYKNKLSYLEDLRVTAQRKSKARNDPERVFNATPKRLATREESATLRAAALKREIT